MGILIDVVDIILLVTLIFHIPLKVRKAQPHGSSSMVLAVCVGVFASIFALVSFTVYADYLQNLFMRIFWLIVMLVALFVVRQSWHLPRTSE